MPKFIPNYIIIYIYIRENLYQTFTMFVSIYDTTFMNANLMNSLIILRKPFNELATIKIVAFLHFLYF